MKGIALTIIHWLGTGPSKIIWGFAIASAFLSMWVSNTATALMMLPIAISVIQLVEKQETYEGQFNNFYKVLVLVEPVICSDCLAGKLFPFRMGVWFIAIGCILTFSKFAEVAQGVNFDYLEVHPDQSQDLR